MPNLKSRTRLRPYSKSPGVAAMIPGSAVSVRIYPQRLIGTDLLSGETLFDVEQARPTRFMVIQEIDRKRLVIPNHLIVTHTKEGVQLGERTFKAPPPFEIPPSEKLFLGCHKAPDIDMMRRRCLSAEFLPFLHALGALIPELPGECSLTLDDLPKLFLTATEGLFTPVKGDPLHTGYPNPSTHSPLLFLKKTAEVIRASVKSNPPHHCGSFTKEGRKVIWSRKKELIS